MPPDCGNCRACIANPDKVRYNGAIKNKGGFEMDDNNVMNEDKVGPIQRYYHEDSMARMERANKRWFVAWLITFILLVGCVAGFVWYEAQWEDIETQVTQESESGYNNYIGNDGDIYNGQTDSENSPSGA